MFPVFVARVYFSTEKYLFDHFAFLIELLFCYYYYFLSSLEILDEMNSWQSFSASVDCLFSLIDPFAG